MHCVLCPGLRWYSDGLMGIFFWQISWMNSVYEVAIICTSTPSVKGWELQSAKMTNDQSIPFFPSLFKKQKKIKLSQTEAENLLLSPER